MIGDFQQRINTVVQLCDTLMAQADGSFNPRQNDSLSHIRRGVLIYQDKLESYQQRRYSVHDLKTPLAAVIGFTDMLIEELDGPLTLGQQSKLHQIKRHTRYLLDGTGGLPQLDA
jgi:signal transduction histidine kinase